MDLLLTLGHNSSAIGVENGRIVNGYEQERLTRIKSSSSFPMDAISKVLDSTSPRNVFISHWYDDFEFYRKAPYNSTIERQYNRGYINSLSSKAISLSPQFTHHDAHAYSGIAFFENNVDIQKYKNKEFHVFIADGFGNNQEVLSIYKGYYGDDLKLNLTLLHRIYDYQYSLGLLYQYATSFVGMKENEDEYKFLGYESHIGDYFYYEAIKYLQSRAHTYVIDWFSKIQNTHAFTSNNYIDLSYLMKMKENFCNFFDSVLLGFPETIENQFQKRVIIGFLIQNIIEEAYCKLLRWYDVKNVILAGGLHYNVKLNNVILNTIPGFLSIMPVAGDQGTSIGLYRKYHGSINLKTLCIGKRNLETISHSNVVYVNRSNVVSTITDLLLKNNIVQIVIDNMEFGPRALCNTSTLALPYKQNVDFINTINGRNTVMPMAPVIMDKNLSYFFYEKDYSRVIGSDKYMILTYDYKLGRDEKKYLGVMHKYPLKNIYSGRPQVVSKEHYIYEILDVLDTNIDCKALINTSYNVHGKPIVYNTQDAINDFEYQLAKIKEFGLDESKLHLVICNEIV